jgi:hypothetical protein
MRCTVLLLALAVAAMLGVVGVAVAQTASVCLYANLRADTLCAYLLGRGGICQSSGPTK